MGAECQLTDNSEQIKKAAESAIEKALEAIGIQAESHAKSSLTSSGAVDTGLLRNSVTHAISGKAPAINSYKANRKSKYGTRYETSGSYSGSAPSSGLGKKAVYVGTNVEYAPYIENGTSRMGARPFIKPAASEHGDEYRAIAKKFLEGG